MTERVSMVSPVPSALYALALEWMLEDRHANFDDFGPATLEEVEAKFRDDKIRSWGVYLDGVPCGFIACTRVAPHLAMFAGICFTRRVHGKAVARTAVEKALDRLWSEGVEKVSAVYFADNRRVARFLQKLGAEHEGLLRAQTKRNGKPVDMELVALFRPKEK